MSYRYAGQLGENAYRVFNVVTEFASHPPENVWVRRDCHSLKRLARSWLNDFSRECHRAEFNFADYLD
jgi:hypothetical protein